MKFAYRLLWFSIANAVVFYLAFLLGGNYVVFGNVVAAPVQAIIMASIIVAFVVALLGELAKSLKYPETTWMAIYWAINTLTIWFLARTEVSEIVGIGLPGFWVAVVLGFVVNLVQYGLLNVVTHKKPKRKR
jgi:hypothetical protein